MPIRGREGGWSEKWEISRCLGILMTFFFMFFRNFSADSRLNYFEQAQNQQQKRGHHNLFTSFCKAPGKCPVCHPIAPALCLGQICGPVAWPVVSFNYIYLYILEFNKGKWKTHQGKKHHPLSIPLTDRHRVLLVDFISGLTLRVPTAGHF